MKRIHWLTMLGVSGTGLAALLLGQSVLGQPEMKVTLPLPPRAVGQPELPAPKSGAAKAPVEIVLEEAPQFPPMGPVAPDLPAPLPAVPQVSVQPAPMPLRVETSAFPAKQVSGPVSLDVEPGKQQAMVSIEWAAPTTIRVNQPMTCQIVVRNTSVTPAQNVIVRHRLGQGVVCKASEPAATNDGGELVWNLGTLSAEQARRIDLTLVTATRGPLNCHAVVTFSAVAAHQVHVREPQLAVKMAGPDKVIAGENITLLFAISNPGDGVAENVKLKTLLPDGLEHPRGKIIEFDVGNLQPKENKVVQLICHAKGGGAQKCAIHVAGEGGLTASDSAPIDILTPKLDVAMSGPKLRYLDRHAVYVLKVSNPGSAPASNVEVQERIPAGFRFHQANNGGQYQEVTRLVSWNLGELQPGQAKDIAVDLIPIEIGEHRLTAEAKAGHGLQSAADIRTSVEGISSLLLEVGHADDPIEVGAETEYEIRVANNGTKLETNVEVICTLPAQLEFKGAKCSTTLRYQHEGRELVFEPLPRLAPKADVIYRVQVRGVAPGDIRFRTRIKSDSLKEPVMREDSTRIYSDGGPARPATSTPAPTIPSIPGSTPMVTPMPMPMPMPSSGTPIPIPLPSAPSSPLPSSKAPVAPPLVPLPLPVPSSSTPMPAANVPSISAPIPLGSVPSGLPSIPASPLLPAAPSVPLPAPPPLGGVPLPN